MAGQDGGPRRPGAAPAPALPEPDELFDPDAALEAIRARGTAVPQGVITADESPALDLQAQAKAEDELPVPDLAGEEEEGAAVAGATDVGGGVEDDDLVFEPEVESEPGLSQAGDPEPAPTDPFFETSQDPRIPEGQESFRIGEVAQLVGVRPYVIRYWEAEFPSIQPDKTEAGQRRYDRDDVAKLLQIKRLRHDHQLTVAQTRAVVEEGASASGIGAAIPNLDSEDRRAIKVELTRLRREVLDLLEWVQD